MSYSTIILNLERAGVATITLNRPDKHHAFNAEMISELHHAAGCLGGDETVRVVVLASSGTSFCAGGDLAWMKEQHDASRQQKIAEATKLAMMLKAYHDLPKPLVCRVQGNAFGGGLGLMAVSDIVVAVKTARFALTEVRLGLIPATIGPFVMSKIGSASARSVFITGSAMDAGRAHALGLVSHIVNEAGLDEAVGREIETALEASPEAMERAKRMLREFTAASLDQQIEAAIEHLADCWESDEARARIEAFLNKAQGKPV